jgi:glucan-binding YG repeat protein
MGPFLEGKPVQAETGNTPINLGFTPNDTIIDPNKPVIYATELGSKTIYAVNFSTGEMKTLTLPYPAEKLDLKNNMLYVTQQKMSHTHYTTDPRKGAIAEVDTENFTVTSILDINEDPYDIAVDQNGFIYVSPGSNQHGNLKVYSMKDKIEITQNMDKTAMYESTDIRYNAETSKIYAINTHSSPTLITAYEVVNGVIQNKYNSPYSNDYFIRDFAKFSFDGLKMYNTSGNVFDLAAKQSGDMIYSFTFGKRYTDFEFSLQHQLTFAASTTRGIDVYQYGTNKYLYALRKDLQVQKLYFQNGFLVTINKDASGKYFIETMNANTQPTSGLPDTPGKPDPAGTLKNLGFKPNDTAIDPNKPIMYMTKLGSKTIYAVNFSTGEIKALALPYPAERLELYKNNLYVTQHKMAHQYSTQEPLVGAIAEVDTQTFTATKLIEVDTDPYDIAIDENGYAYISPGSNQFGAMKVYSLASGGEIPNSSFTNMRAWSYLNYNPVTSKVYAIDTASSPRDVDAFEVKNGVIQNHYDSPYHGDYPLEPIAKITPDGLSMYNNSGVVFKHAASKAADMKFSFRLGKEYSDYEFSLQDQMTFAARMDGGIDVYKYNTSNYLYTIGKDLTVQKLHYQHGKLAALCKDSSGKYFVESIDAATPGKQDVIEFLEAASVTWDDEDSYYDSFYHGVKDVPLESFFALHFDQSISVKDGTKISIKGPNGNVKINSVVDDDTLSIEPYLLTGSTTYTLTIKKEALSGSLGQNLANDIVIQFKTASNWEQYAGKWYYYDPAIGDYVTGWKNISGTWFYFNDNGEMHTGWEKVNNVWYYLNKGGEMQTGWLKQGTTWYYFTGSGAMKTGWQKVGTTWYYFNGSGAMQTGWCKIGTTWYYLQSNGAMKTGWLQSGKNWYYFYSSGAMAYNTKIGGYKFGANGAWIK